MLIRIFAIHKSSETGKAQPDATQTVQASNNAKIFLWDTCHITNTALDMKIGTVKFHPN